MNRKCQKCGHEYSLGALSLDQGLCPKCMPGFLGTPLWMQPVQAGTRDLWCTVLVLHILLFFLFGLLLDGGVVSVPGCIYCITVIAYLLVRFTIAQVRGYPILTKFQAVALLLLPAYGPVLVITLFLWAQRMRWENLN